MAILFVSANGTTDIDSGASETISLTITNATDMVIVGFETVDVEPTSITFNSFGMTEGITRLDTDYLDKYCGLYYILNANLPVAGTYNVTITGGVNRIFGAIALSGTAQQAPTATAQQSDDTADTDKDINISVSTANSWVIDAIQGILDTGFVNQVCNNDTTRGDVEVDTGGDWFSFGMSTMEDVSIGTTNMSWTQDGGVIGGHAAMVIAPAQPGHYIGFANTLQTA